MFQCAARDTGGRSARRVISPAMAVLYSTSPRRSATGVADRHRESRGLGNRLLIEGFAAQRLLGVGRTNRGVGDIGQRNAHVGDRRRRPCATSRPSAAVAKSPVLRLSFA